MTQARITNMNRREFLKDTAAGLTFALTLAADPSRIIAEAAAEGSFTTLPAIIAEELDADWAKVKPILPPVWDEKKYGNPGFGGNFQTSASASVNGYFKPLRLAGAQARRVLIEAV